MSQLYDQENLILEIDLKGQFSTLPLRLKIPAENTFLYLYFESLRASFSLDSKFCHYCIFPWHKNLSWLSKTCKNFKVLKILKLKIALLDLSYWHFRENFQKYFIVLFSSIMKMAAPSPVFFPNPREIFRKGPFFYITVDLRLTTAIKQTNVKILRQFSMTI